MPEIPHEDLPPGLLHKAARVKYNCPSCKAELIGPLSDAGGAQPCDTCGVRHITPGLEALSESRQEKEREYQREQQKKREAEQRERDFQQEILDTRAAVDRAYAQREARQRQRRADPEFIAKQQQRSHHEWVAEAKRAIARLEFHAAVLMSLGVLSFIGAVVIALAAALDGIPPLFAVAVSSAITDRKSVV